MRVTRIISIIICLWAATGCEESSELNLPSTDTGMIAVEAVLTNENIQHEIRLSLPYQSLNGNAKPLTGAIVDLMSRDTTLNTTETSPGSGIYLTPKMRAITGTRYTLRIRSNGKEFTASDSSVAVEPLQPLSTSAVEGGFVINFQESGQQPNYIDYHLDWTKSPSCQGACSGRVVFYDLKNIDVNELYKPAKTNLVFPAQTTIIRKKHSVSAAYRAFLRSMLSETEWRGGVFDVTRDNAPTNLSEGAIGFFAVTTVVADTLTVK